MISKSLTKAKSDSSIIIYYPDRSPPPDLGFVGNILRFIWNRQDGTFLGRTPVNWVIMLAFYFVFWCCVIGFFCLMVYITLSKIHEHDRPYLRGDDGCMRGYPALGFQPNIRLSSPLVYYGWEKNVEKPSTYTHEIDKFLKGYTLDREKNDVCIDRHNPQVDRVKPCHFDVKVLGPCAVGDYGYQNRTPCIYFKLNKIYGWVPKCYNDSSDLPKKMPAHLKEQIKKMHAERSIDMDSVWISCQGAHPADTQHMGRIEFYPYPGFPNGFYPYRMQKHFLSPVVAGRFMEVTRDTLVTVRCQAWAHNINAKRGRVEFQLMLASKK